MTFRPKTLLTMFCLAWVFAAPPLHAGDFGAPGQASDDRSDAAIQLAKKELLVQFFEKNRRRKGRNQRRQQRKQRQFDTIPLRTAPGSQGLQMRELDRRDRSRSRKQRRDQKDAAEGVRRGEMLPLSGIIRSAQSQCPGKFLGAQLQRGGKGISYRVRILRPSGRRVALTIDAKTGAMVGGRCG